MIRNIKALFESPLQRLGWIVVVCSVAGIIIGNQWGLPIMQWPGIIIGLITFSLIFNHKA